MKPLRENIRGAAIRLGIAYFIFFLVSLAVSLSANSLFHRRLAEAFSQSAHNSLVTTDFRQAVGILYPALAAHFSSVSFHSKNQSYFALPSESITQSLLRSYWHSSVSIKVSTSDQDRNEDMMLDFTYPWANPVQYLLLAWTVFLIMALPIFNYLKKNIETRHFEILAVREAEVKASVTSQVAHDIRSPLAALSTAVGSFESAPQDAKRIIQTAIKRINDIANDLLKSGSREKDTEPTTDEKRELDLSQIITSVLEEKTIEFRGRKNITFGFSHDATVVVESSLNESDLRRILSNLVNNSFEAIPDDGQIKFYLDTLDGSARIKIVDNGRGIPSDILKKIGSKGFSFNKDPSSDSGSGLGLYNAFNVLNAAGANLNIDSVMDGGTVVTILLPKVSIETHEKFDAIIIDDDKNILELWKIVAQTKQKKVACYLSPSAFFGECRQFSRNVPVYVDVELGNNLRGEKIAEQISELGFSEIFLATGYSPLSIRAPKCVKKVVGKEPIL